MVAFEKLFINKWKNKMIINCFLKCSLDDPFVMENVSVFRESVSCYHELQSPVHH